VLALYRGRNYDRNNSGSICFVVCFCNFRRRPNMEDSRCSSAVADFERGKDKMKWIAVTNPTGTTIHCSGTLIDSNGNTLGGNTVSISSFGQASFTLGNTISQANSSPSSYNLDCQGAPFEALAIAGNSRGITSGRLRPAKRSLSNDLERILSARKSSQQCPRS
jgi:hypothetical protein